MCHSVLEYGIANVTISHPYLEFDITAKTNLTSLFLEDTKIVLDYAPTLGSSIVFNNKLEVTKEGLLQNNAYIIQTSDVTPQKFAIDVKNSSPLNLEEVSRYPRVLCHVRMEVNPSNSISGLVKFDSLLMKDESYYLSAPTGIKKFDCTYTSGDAFYNFANFTFYPDTINAGIKDSLFIVGTGFGAIEGEVFMRNSEVDVANDPRYFMPMPKDHVTWTDTKISIHVTSLTGSIFIGPDEFTGGTATGMPMLKLSSGTVIVPSDSSNVEIFYSITNSGYDKRYNLGNINGEGGYTFYLGASLAIIPNARAVIEQVLLDWQEATCLNFKLSNITIDDPSITAAKDSINLIGLYIPTDSTILMHTFRHLDLISFNANGDLTAWPLDIDILINQNKPWYIDTMPITDSTKYDFYAAFSHEIGHAHSLNHVLGVQSPGIARLMVPGRKRGTETRIIGDSPQSGGIDVMNNNLIELVNNSSTTVAPPMDKTPGCITNTDDIYSQEASTELFLFPNPVYETLHIKSNTLIQGNAIISIFELTGRKLMSKEITSFGEDQLMIDLSDLTNGVFFIKIDTKSWSKTGKIIKL